MVPGLQEEMVHQGMSVWQFSYFIRASGILLDGHQLDDLPPGRKETVLSIPRPPTGTYSDLLVTPDSGDLTRLADLFVVLLRQKAAVGQGQSIERGLTIAWTQHAGRPSQVRIALQERLITQEG